MIEKRMLETTFLVSGLVLVPGSGPVPNTERRTRNQERETRNVKPGT